VAGSGKDFAGGRTVPTPFGNLVSPNITPDPETGIGSWTDDEFVNALTKGTGRNGMLLYPAMPYTYMTKMSRDDVLAIRAYLRTVPAVHNEVESNQLSFPFNIRAGMAAWNAMFFHEGAFKPVEGKSDEWNRGAYLAEGPAHCGMCHTPKNFLGGDKTGNKLQGYALQGWFAPDITNDARRGLGGWSVDDIAEYLKTGHNRSSAATGLMSEMISLSTSHMTDEDVRAIATYLKDQRGAKAQSPDKPDAAAMKTGEKIYADECSGCHTPNGRGTPGMFPSINGSPAVQQTDATTLMRVVLRGARSAGTDAAPTAPAMPAFGWLLSDSEVAAVLTYVRNTWGNAAPPVTAGDVAKARKDFAQRRD
jgi:mono/diheme cytochrome c family protein